MKTLGRIALLFVGLTITFALSTAFGHDSGHSSSHSTQNSSDKKKEDEKKSDGKASPTPIARMTALQSKSGSQTSSTGATATSNNSTKKTTTRRIATKAKPSATITTTNGSQIPGSNNPAVPGSGVKVGTGTKNSGAPDTTTTTSGGTTTSAGSKFTGPSDSNTNPIVDATKLPTDGSRVNTAIQNGAAQNGDTAHPGDFAPNKGLTAITDADAALIAAGAKGPALPGNKSGTDLVNGAGTNPTEPTGTSKQNQQSEDDKTNEYGGETHQATMGNTTAFVKEDANGVTRETFVINMATGLARTTHFDASGKQSGAAITRDQNGSVVYDKNDTRTSVGVRQATSKQPNPETDTGDHVPSNIVGDLNGNLPTIGQAAQQKKNQVTMPGEARNSGPKMNVDPIEALKNGVGQRTDGRINPINDDGTTTSKNIGSGKPGSGLEQVDKTSKGPGGPLGNPKPPGAPGTGPDNPTSDSGPNGSPHP